MRHFVLGNANASGEVLFARAPAIRPQALWQFKS
jgi:hypothetical protein